MPKLERIQTTRRRVAVVRFHTKHGHSPQPGDRGRTEVVMNADDFPFAKSGDAKRFCDRIVEAMIRFCDLSRKNAVCMIREFWADTEDLESDPLLYQEPPYYYAMSIAHHPVIGDNRPLWYKDPSLWPPPIGWSRH